MKIFASFWEKKDKKTPHDNFDSSCPSPACLPPRPPLMPVSVSGRAAMTSQHERTVTLDTSAVTLAGRNKNPTKYVNTLKTTQSLNLHPSVQPA